MFVCLGNCIGKFCKNSIDVIIQGFHIRVLFFSHDFDVILNVFKIRFCWRRRVRKDSRDNRYFSLDTMEMERLFLERDVVRNIYWLGLLCDL